jgi:hypothetical protein
VNNPRQLPLLNAGTIARFSALPLQICAVLLQVRQIH